MLKNKESALGAAGGGQTGLSVLGALGCARGALFPPGLRAGGMSGCPGGARGEDTAGLGRARRDVARGTPDRPRRHRDCERCPDPPRAPQPRSAAPQPGTAPGPLPQPQPCHGRSRGQRGRGDRGTGGTGRGWGPAGPWGGAGLGWCQERCGAGIATEPGPCGAGGLRNRGRAGEGAKPGGRAGSGRGRGSRGPARFGGLRCRGRRGAGARPGLRARCGPEGGAGLPPPAAPPVPLGSSRPPAPGDI